MEKINHNLRKEKIQRFHFSLHAQYGASKIDQWETLKHSLNKLCDAGPISVPKWDIKLLKDANPGMHATGALHLVTRHKGKTHLIYFAS